MTAGQTVHAGLAAVGADLLPGRQETAVGRGADRLDLGAQRRQRSPPQDPQHLGVAPLLARPMSVGASVNSPRTSSPSTASRPSTSAATRRPSPNRAATSAVVNGPWVRA